MVRAGPNTAALWQLPALFWPEGIVLGQEDLSSCGTRSEGVEDEVVHLYSEEERRILLWRLAEFARLGFAYPESVALAGTGVDLGEARKLVACGCPAETASRILL